VFLFVFAANQILEAHYRIPKVFEPFVIVIIVSVASTVRIRIIKPFGKIEIDPIFALFF
jgi:hypothetical protein